MTKTLMNVLLGAAALLVSEAYASGADAAKADEKATELKKDEKAPAAAKKDEKAAPAADAKKDEKAPAADAKKDEKAAPQAADHAAAGAKDATKKDEAKK